MKSKKVLAQIAAFSLVFGMTGMVSSWADELIIEGTVEKVNDSGIDTVAQEEKDGSFSVSGRDIKGLWLKKGSKLIATNVNFIDGGEKLSEVSVDTGSTLVMNGGSIASHQDAFNVNDGSTADVNNAKVTTGAWANNAAIHLKNTITSGNMLYAGNSFPDSEEASNTEELPVGSITIDGGTANVKNILVQNKGTVTVENGAVLDLTGDTSATDAEWTQPKTGIMNHGSIVVRAFGPGENKRIPGVESLQKETGFEVSGNSTVKADSIEAAGGTNNSQTLQVHFSADNSTIETNTMHLGKYGFGNFKDSRIIIKDMLKLDGENNLDLEGGSASLNEVILSPQSQVNFNGTDATMKSARLDNAVMETWDNSFKADEVDVMNGGMFEAYNGAKVNVTQMNADNGTVYLYEMPDGKGTPHVAISQMNLENASTIRLAAGELQANTITMDHSAIDIVGAGVLAADKMTLNGTTLSLNGISSTAGAKRFMKLASINNVNAPSAVNNGVTVEVKDSLTVNNGGLKVNDGSKLITNKLLLNSDSTVNVDGENSAYTIQGSDNEISGNAKISAVNGGTVTLAKGAGIKAEADADNKVKTVLTADAKSKVDVSQGSLYIKGAKKDGTVYDVSTAVKSGTENKGNEFGTIYGDSRRTKAIEKDENGKYTFKSNIDEIAKDSSISNILEKADDEGKGKLTDFMDKAFGEGTTDEEANSALDHAASMAEMAGVTHGTYGFAQDFSGVIEDHRGEGRGIWANYLHQDKKVDGFNVSGYSAKYDVKYNGFLIGSDLVSNEKSTIGIAFAYANGSNKERDGVTARDDTKYYGGDIYHHFTSGGILYKADIGFIKSDNDLRQTQLGMTITGSTDGNAFFAGIRAEKEFALGNSSLTPYAGLRYYRVHTDDFTDSLGMKHKTDNANIWNLPVGLEFRHEVKNGNWNLTPVAEIGYIFAMGDKDTKETISFDSASDTFGFDLGENTFLARLGVEAGNTIWTLGGGYRYQKGSDIRSNQWYIQAGYRF